MADLKRLKGSERVRKRVSVMMGSDDIRGCQHTLFEIVSNSIDRHRKGFGNYIKVIKYEDLSYTIIDHADGLPMDWNDKENAYNWDLALKVLYAGDNYDANSTALGINGLGLCSSQYASEYMKVISYKDGKKYTVKCKKGRPIDKETEEFICGDDDNLFTKEQGERVLLVESNTESKTGTYIHYKPDLEVFTNIDISIDWINDKLDKQSMVNKGLKIEVYDEKEDKLYTHYYESGIKDYIKTISDDNNFSDVIYFTDKGKGRDKVDKPEYDYNYEIALVFNNEINKLEYYHNSSELLQGGSTADAINLAFTYAINEYAKDNNLFNKNESKIKFTDIQDSLICVISSFSTMTSYANQTKLSIDNKFIKDFTNQSLKEKLKLYFIENKLEAGRIVNQILINKRANDKAEKTKLNIKKTLQTKSNFDDTDNFYACTSNDKSITELYLAEGSSAQGSIVMGRNSKFQACYHVGGKMLSLLKADYEKIFKNKVVRELFQYLGCGIEIKSKHNKDLNTFDESKLNYNKIILATDQDTDAFQIRCLMLTAIYRLAPTLIKHGYVYIAESPLYEITTADKVYHAYTEEEKITILEELSKKGIKYDKPERNKGLGEVDSDIIAETMMNPKTRKITRVTVQDVEKMANTFELWLGDEVKPRKEVITSNFDYIEHFDNEQEKDIVKVLNENYLPYAIEVIKERAIISIDGFKPAHRKLLWTLHESNLYNKRTKSAHIVGSNMSLNVHGDGSIYETLVRMAQKDTLLYPYVNGKGNFGQHTSKSLQNAHMRYTEAGASNINKEFFHDINKNAVDFVPNFDGEKEEPILLPTTFPNVLVNANKGIAVGMASATPSFNLKEVCDLTIAYIKDTNIVVSDYLLCPDFATGGFIVRDVDKLNQIYETGQGSVTLRAKYEVKDNEIIVTEIPYTTNRESIVKDIKTLCRESKDNIIRNITNVIDSTDRKGMSITIKIKKNTNIELLMEKLYANTKLQDSYSLNMNIVCLDKIPRVLSIKRILDEWLKFRRMCISRVSNYDKKDKEHKLHLLNAFKIILTDIDALVHITRNAIDDDDMIKQLQLYFKIDQEQAEYVSNIKLKKLNKNNIIEITEQQITALQQEISDLKNIQNDETRINNIIIQQLQNIRDKYKIPRKTEIINVEDIPSVTLEDIKIEDFNPTLVLTEQQYIKKNRVFSQSQKLKDDDKILQFHQCNNKDDLLLFTNKGNVLIRKVYELDEHKPSTYGDFLPNLLGEHLENDEKVIYISTTKDYKGSVVSVFENGYIARTDLQTYKPKQNRQIPMSAYNTDSGIVSIQLITNDTDILLVSQEGKSLIINTSQIRPTKSRNTQGVSGMKIDIETNKIIASIIGVTVDDNFNIETEKGKSKFIMLNDVAPNGKESMTEYLKGNRNTQGNFIYNTRQKNDKVIKLTKQEN
ncbi:DNA topoisomerase [Clostridium botulinum D/C]|uniref:DNA gyrase subunit A n=1 Tax=Clostridium botulinum TaxID=1491 RepID=UPI001E404D38|nr:DNA gyrase subunit A [Clostridium botulinum]MCD3321668.1 DNA topoisomerase [Clostridium botulinum D/C]MCD3324948.1 DNA topoisomerase [Clostridium botulinum D/C]MCD3327726.1 DNA topoisomerase [Clostridium botulinum D/C]